MAGIWILADSRERAFELLNIGREMADRAGTRVVAVLRVREQAEESISRGADEVILLPSLPADQPYEAYITPISEEVRKENPDLVLLPATVAGKNMAVLMAARLGAGLVSSCTSLGFDEKNKTFVMERLMYGGTAVQKVVCTTRPTMATIPPRTFEAAQPLSGRRGPIRELRKPSSSAVKVIERRPKEKETKDITEARVIICVGRGMDKKEDLTLAKQLAEAVGGAIGCTRPIAEEFHWLPEDLCIGLSGVQVKPDLYLGIGVSGQVQHVTGIRGAKVIAAINKDENAPIFKVADLGIIGDLYDVMPKLVCEMQGRT
ncbi:MAG TPA: electron transfer flavoprotein subunit alpha/FixB family protein [Syntrophales bacterium]|nr:electron transfer flavoprotein subunit alpha/FixB family protein [Syntrophales bacterium]